MLFMLHDVRHIELDAIETMIHWIYLLVGHHVSHFLFGGIHAGE